MKKQSLTMLMGSPFRKLLSFMLMGGLTNLWYRRLPITIVILFLIGVSSVSTDNNPNPQIAQGYGDFNMPPFVKERLEKESIRVEDLKNDRKEGKRKEKDRVSQNDFYEVIIANNLFRPLGYRKPKSSSSLFELIGTVVHHETGKTKAFIRSHKDSKLYYVEIGAEFAGAKVEMIEPHKVTLLHEGELKKLRISKVSFINSGGRSSSGGNKEGGKGSGGRDFKGNFNFEMERKIIKMKKRMIDASPEERKKLLRQIKEMLRRREGD